jgi:hypothetical protein
LHGSDIHTPSIRDVDESPLLRPVGPEPARVYWVRRAAVVALLVLVIALVAYACGGSGGSPKPRAAPSSSPTSTTPPPSPVALTICRHADLAVEASTDAAVYPAGSAPRLAAVVRNVSGRTCRFQTAPGARVWTILSGADRVWSSADCTLSGVLARTRLKAGKTIVYGLVWDRHRSAQGCPSALAEAQPGTYRLYVTIAGVQATPVIFHLTG